MTKKDKPMVTQDSKAVFYSTEKCPSAAPAWRVGMLVLLCAALFTGCGGGDSPLAEALKNIQSPDAAFRLQGIKTLGDMGEKAKPHAAKVAALLKDDSEDVRAATIGFLIGLGDNSPEVVQELGAMASGDADKSVQINALFALNTLGANDAFVEACKAILKGDDAGTKTQVIMAIDQSEGKESVTALKAELEAIAGGSDADLATAAKGALKKLE